MSEFYFDVGKWEEDLSRRGRKLMAEEGDPAGEEGTRKRKRKRPSKKDLVCVLHILFLFFVAFKKSFFPSRRIGLKNRKISRNLLKQLGCVLNFLWRYISMEESIIMSTTSRANVLLFAHEVVGITMV